MGIAGGWPDHLLSLAEFDELPEELSRQSELVEGVLLVAPKPAPMHQRTVARLWALLQEQLPAELTAATEVDVVLSGDPIATVRAPDLIVLPNALAEANPARFHALDVLVAIEVISPGSDRTDRVTTMSEYAEAGIAHYWVIELGPPPHLATYALVNPGRPYRPGVSGTGIVDLAEPAQLHLDLDSLMRR